MSVTVCRRKLPPVQAQSIVLEGAIRIDDPPRQDRQALLDVVGLDLVEIEPLAARIGACELFGQQLVVTRVGFPGYMTWRIAFMELSETGEILLTARVMLTMAVG